MCQALGWRWVVQRTVYGVSSFKGLPVQWGKWHPERQVMDGGILVLLTTKF